MVIARAFRRARLTVKTVGDSTLRTLMPQDASYGYDGYYVDLGEYQHYFREGFRRGYEDGYYSRSQYGSYSNGGYSILGAILEQILGLQLLD
jgi:hypothetical protein